MFRREQHKTDDEKYSESRKPLYICFASVCLPRSSLSTTVKEILQSNDSLQLD